MAFLSVEECISKLLIKPMSLPNIVETDLLVAKNHVLAEDIVAEIDVPPADNSAMDGYAMRAIDAQNSATLPISQRIQAGDAPTKLMPKTAARIFTGAEIPTKADAVAMQENCSANENHVTFTEPVSTGANIRRRGQDIAKGTTILKKGQRLRAQELGLLASLGIHSVKTYRALKVAIVNTGNELVEPGKPLKTGQIYNSNRFLLNGILSGWGFDIEHSDIVTDTFDATKKALLKASQTNDIVVTTGGVSVGEEDHIKPAVAELGDIDIWKVSIKPGKPFAFGHINKTPFIGLPGNPSSVFATLLILARHYLHSRQGMLTTDIPVHSHTATATFNRKTASREEYLRAKYSKGQVAIYKNQSSGVLTSASWGNCFVKQSIGEEIKEGQAVNILMYTDLLD